MAVSAQIEWKLETAFVAVLGDNADLSAARIVRADQATATDADDRYPAITVRAGETVEEAWSALGDYSRSYVEITAYTYTRTDTTGATVAALLGGIRDTLYGATLATDLSDAVTGLTVHGVELTEPALILDADRTRSRALTVTVHASARDIG